MWANPMYRHPELAVVLIAAVLLIDIVYFALLFRKRKDKRQKKDK
jgi:hypothetical protein